MARSAAKRFYKRAGTAPSEGGVVVELDGRPVKTPLGNALVLPTARLAEAVAAEWEAQKDDVRPATMPLTQLAVTALDRMSANRDEIVSALAAFGGSDLLCYWADGPDDLVRRQAAAWQPLLDWAAETFGAAMTVTAGVRPVSQSEASLAALRAAVAALDDFQLAALGLVVPMSGSLILGLALLAGRLDAAGVSAAAFVDETYQTERWGEDAEALARRQAVEDDIAAAAAFLALIKDRPRQ